MSLNNINHTCSSGKIDNVNDPEYNIQNVIKQTILLEEHLAQDNKYCKACICKHFLHIIGLLEEAKWMAKKEYPLLNDSVKLYNEWFKLWVKNKDNNQVRVNVLQNLRQMRQALIGTYYL